MDAFNPRELLEMPGRVFKKPVKKYKKQRFQKSYSKPLQPDIPVLHFHGRSYVHLHAQPPGSLSVNRIIIGYIAHQDSIDIVLQPISPDDQMAFVPTLADPCFQGIHMAQGGYNFPVLPGIIFHIGPQGAR
jgi:hypothetical protein